MVTVSASQREQQETATGTGSHIVFSDNICQFIFLARCSLTQPFSGAYQDSDHSRSRLKMALSSVLFAV